MNKVNSNGIPHITCLESVHLVSQRRDGELDELGEQRLLLHVSTCDRCAVASKQFQSLFLGLDNLFRGATARGQVGLPVEGRNQ
jgi:hypothetical protein